MLKNQYIHLCLLLMFTFAIHAQQQINGNVSDAFGPLPGASVVLKGTSVGTTTDFDGNYTINLQDGYDTLIFSYIGYKTKEVEIEGQTVINTVLEESAESLQEVVVTAQGIKKSKKALGYAIAKSPLLCDLLAPIIVTFQSTPIVAYAPLLVIWFDTGMESKIVTCALVVFFPMLMNTVVGIRNVPGGLRDVMRVSQATPLQIFTKLELPAAMPVLMTGLKTSATLAVIGAVVGEFIVAKAGLGFWINLARQQYNTELVFVAMIAMAMMAGSLYAVVSLLERRLLAWQRRSN